MKKLSCLLNFSLAALLVKFEPVFLVILTFILILVLCIPIIVWFGCKFMDNLILNYPSYKRFDEFVIRYLKDPKSKLTLYCLIMASIGLFFLVTLFLLYFFFVVYFDLHLDQYITWNLILHSWNNPLYVTYMTLLLLSFIFLIITWNNILFWNNSVRFWIIWFLSLIGGFILIANFFDSYFAAFAMEENSSIKTAFDLNYQYKIVKSNEVSGTIFNLCRDNPNIQFNLNKETCLCTDENLKALNNLAESLKPEAQRGYLTSYGVDKTLSGFSKEAELVPSGNKYLKCLFLQRK